MALNAAAKDIKIPTHHYVGFQARSNDDVPLGFMTPDGTDAAATKRKATVDHWARGYGTKDPKIAAATYENKPLTGFKLGREIRRHSSWGQGNVKWRIEDPRGFELEISSPNFASIILCTTLEKGEILEECVWARQGSENVLLPVSSDEYKQAQVNTTRNAKKVSLKDLEPGHYVVMQNGEEGIYLGSHFTYVQKGGGYYGEGPKAGWQDKKRFFIGQQTDGKWTGLECKASIKVAEVRESDVGVMTLTDAERLLNTLLCKPMGRYGSSVSIPGNDYGYVRGVSSTKPRDEDSTMEFEAVTFDDLWKLVDPKVPYAHNPSHWSGNSVEKYVVAKLPTAVTGQYIAYQFDPQTSIVSLAQEKAGVPVRAYGVSHPLSHARQLVGDWENFEFTSKDNNSSYYGRYTDARIFDKPGVEFYYVKVSFTTAEGGSGSFYL